MVKNCICEFRDERPCRLLKGGDLYLTIEAPQSKGADLSQPVLIRNLRMAMAHSYSYGVRNEPYLKRHSLAGQQRIFWRIWRQLYSRSVAESDGRDHRSLSPDQERSIVSAGITVALSPLRRTAQRSFPRPKPIE